jgi:hypothetical protein
MIYLTNIHRIGDYLYAHVLNIETGEEVDIKVHRSKNIFSISSGETFGIFVKACGELQWLGKNCKVLPKEKYINWGM